jgi:transcriptional regulator with XRE-family HTH domain
MRGVGTNPVSASRMVSRLTWIRAARSSRERPALMRRETRTVLILFRPWLDVAGLGMIWTLQAEYGRVKARSGRHGSTMRRVAADDLAARVRAAFAYKGLSKSARAKALGVSARQVTRIEAGEASVNPDRLAAIARATGVPRGFLEDGFAPDEPTVPERLEATEHQVGTVRDEIKELRETDATLQAGIVRLEQALQEIRDRDRRRGRGGASG